MGNRYHSLSALILRRVEPDTFVAADLLFYESPKHKVLGQPVECSRNQRIEILRRGNVSRHFLEAWAEGHDSEAEKHGVSELSCLQAGDRAATYSGGSWPIDLLAKQALSARKGLPNPVVSNDWVRHNLKPTQGTVLAVDSVNPLIPVGHESASG